MKKLIILFVAFLMLVFCNVNVSQANGITLGFDPLSQGVLVGDPAIVDLVISGLGDGVAPSLGVFDLYVSFDPSILAFDTATFGDPVLGDQVDMSGDAAFYDALWGPGLYLGYSIYSPGVLNIFEVSCDSVQDLINNQADSFTLATLTFDTLGVGTSFLDITDPDPSALLISRLGDADANPLTADLYSGNINVVPEPATMLLLGSGLAGLGFLRKKKKNQVS